MLTFKSKLCCQNFKENDLTFFFVLQTQSINVPASDVTKLVLDLIYLLSLHIYLFIITHVIFQESVT